jgi:hypothetical protein
VLSAIRQEKMKPVLGSTLGMQMGPLKLCCWMLKLEEVQDEIYQRKALETPDSVQNCR